MNQAFPWLLLPVFWSARNRARRREKGDGARATLFGLLGLGVAAGILLLADSHLPGGLNSWLRHPLLTSFLHRTFLCALASFIALVVVSRLTPPP